MSTRFDPSRRRLVFRLAPAAVGGALALGACDSQTVPTGLDRYTPTFFTRIERAGAIVRWRAMMVAALVITVDNARHSAPMEFES